MTVLAIAAAAGTAAQAQGSTVNRMQGTFTDDPNSSISFGVRVDETGTPVRVSRIQYADVDLVCKDGSTIEISGSAPGGEVLRQPNADGLTYFTGGEASPQFTHFDGALNRKGTKVRGGLYAYTGTFEDGVLCMTGDGPGSVGPATEAPYEASMVGRNGSGHGASNQPRRRHLTGQVFGDPNSRIDFDVLFEDGEPVGISDVTYSNLDMNCKDGSVVELSGVAPRRRGLIDTHRGPAFNAGSDGSPVVHFVGYLSKSGKRAKGDFFAFVPGTDLSCTTGDGIGPGRDTLRWFAN